MKSAIALLREKAELILACTVLLILWLVHAGESLWLDELQTTWVIQGPFDALIDKVFDTQGFTPFYYSILWLFSPIILGSEQLLRLPSLVVTIFSGLAIYCCALRISGKLAAGLAALIFLSMDEVVEASLSARPYALALSLSVFSVFFLMRWLGSGRKFDQYLYILTYLLSVYSHYLFAGTLVFHFLYFILKRQVCLASRRQYTITGLYLGIGFVPLVPQINLMLAKRDLMAIATMPTVADLLLGIIPWISLIPIVLAFFISLCSLRVEEKVFRRSRLTDWPLLCWLLAYAFLPALILYAVSITMGTSLFLARYYLWFAPGFALLWAYLSEYLQNTRMREFLVLVLALLVIAFEFTKQRSHEDWRGAIEYSNQLIAESSEEPPLLLMYSGVLESANPAWMTLSLKQGQFSAPLSYYHSISQPTLIPLLAMDNLGIDGYWQVNIVPKLSSTKRVILLCLNNLSWQIPEQANARQIVCDAIDHEIAKLNFEQVAVNKFQRVVVSEYKVKN